MNDHAATVHGPTREPDVVTPCAMADGAFPISHVDLSLTKHQSGDLGEVLSRSPGVNVRRTGGLGSPLVLGLYGSQGDAVRVLWNDLPLELQGYSQPLADLPLFQLARIDLYRGVVPIRFGVDAREGALNVIAPLPERPYGAEGYYQLGSFGTHRAGVSGHYRHEPTGLFTRLSLYGDLTQNDYDIDVLEVDANGNEREATHRLFHNRYRAAGGDLEVGVTERPWAERLTLRAFMQRLDRELQSNALYTTPYGEARTHTENRGVQLRYVQTFRERLRVEAIAGFTQIATTLVDESTAVYDWRGDVVRERSRSGELGTLGRVRDERHESYARASLSLSLSDAHTLQLTLMPRYTVWPGRGVGGEASVLSLVSGLAHVLTLREGRLENQLFGKSYLQSSSLEELQTATGSNALEHQLMRFGVGDALRVRLGAAWQLWLSYELATRLPTVLELFGDGALTVGNFELKAEGSHNGNLELHFAQATQLGSFRAGANGFVRRVDNEILTVAGSVVASAVNVLRSRTLGVESRVGWSAPDDWLALDANLTFADARSESNEGPFEVFHGERLPGRPYLFANAIARTVWRDLLSAHDELSLSYYYRYVHGYSRTWKSLGAAEFQLSSPTTHLHTLALTYLFLLRDVQLGGSVDAQNLGDERHYGTFGAQLPGRSYYLKLDLRL